MALARLAKGCFCIRLFYGVESDYDHIGSDYGYGYENCVMFPSVNLHQLWLNG